MNENKVIPYTLIDRAREGGPGLALLIISAFLLLGWGFFAVRHRRVYARLGVTTLVLAVIGYLVYDWQHLSLNCSMRDAQTVRDDSVHLLQLRKVTFKDNMELHLHGSEIPASFTRITSATKLASAVPRSSRQGGNGAMMGLAAGLSMATYLPRTWRMTQKLPGVKPMRSVTSSPVRRPRADRWFR